MLNDYVMSFFFLNQIHEDGFHLIVAKMPNNLRESEFLFTVTDVHFSEIDNKQIYLHAKNKSRDISIPLDYVAYEMQRMLGRTYGINIEYYDNEWGELGENFPIKNLEDIFCIDLSQSEINFSEDESENSKSIRNAVAKNLFDLGYTGYMFHLVEITDGILVEF